jgi:hypothetical protein
MGDISITMILPTQNQLSGDPLAVIAVVQSTFELQGGKARVQDREVQLVFSEQAYWDRYGELRPGWVGQVPLSGLAKGPQTLTIIAQDVFGSSASKEVGFIFNEKPIITVEGPMSESVATPLIQVKASSSDDDEADSRIEIWAAALSRESLVLSGGELIDRETDLSDFDHSSVTLRFDGIDSAGQVTSEERLVWVESNPRLVHLRTVPGRIWDVWPDRILHLEGDVLRIRNLASGEDTVVLEGQCPEYGFLSPKGAIFVEQSGNVLTAHVLDFRDGQLIDLSYPNSEGSLKVSGNYAIWNEGRTLLLRDLVSGVNTTVTTGSGNCENDVTPEGVVVYWTYPGYQVFRYHEGSTRQLTGDADLWNTYPLTDGTNVVYCKSTPHSSDTTHAIAMHGLAGEVILAEPRSQGPSPGEDYQVKNAWIAFTKSGTSGQLQVWTRSPSGDLEQRSFFGTSSCVEALNPYGEVVFRNGQTRCLSLPGQSFSSLGRYPNAPKAFWQDGQWLLSIGRSLFAVDTTPPSISVMNPATRSGGEFGLEVRAVNVRKVSIQASTDLQTWEDVATEWVSGGMVSFVDVQANRFPARFYRAKSPAE